MSIRRDFGEPDALAERILAHDNRALARAITWLENGDSRVAALMKRLDGCTGRARVIGITGPPGAGKSTLSDALVTLLRRQGVRVGLLLVDPASPVTGGAILGDRVRLPGHAGDPDVFIRSMSNRGQLGGLSPGTAGASALLDAAGCDWIIIETVGTGQAETDVASLADTVILVMVPGLGDDIQLMKAGIMEIADIYAVNKSDREGAGRLAAEIRATLAQTGGWIPEVVQTSALAGTGLPDLYEAIEKHGSYLLSSGALQNTRSRRRTAQFYGALHGLFEQACRRTLSGRMEAELVRVTQGLEDPFSAAWAVWSELLRCELPPDN